MLRLSTNPSIESSSDNILIEEYLEQGKTNLVNYLTAIVLPCMQAYLNDKPGFGDIENLNDLSGQAIRENRHHNVAIVEELLERIKSNITFSDLIILLQAKFLELHANIYNSGILESRCIHVLAKKDRFYRSNFEFLRNIDAMKDISIDALLSELSIEQIGHLWQGLSVERDIVGERAYLKQNLEENFRARHNIQPHIESYIQQVKSLFPIARDNKHAYEVLEGALAKSKIFLDIFKAIFNFQLALSDYHVDPMGGKIYHLNKIILHKLFAFSPANDYREIMKLVDSFLLVCNLAQYQGVNFDVDYEYTNEGFVSHLKNEYKGKYQPRYIQEWLTLLRKISHDPKIRIGNASDANYNITLLDSSPIGTLPDEMIAKIASYFDEVTKETFQSVNRQYSHFFNKNATPEKYFQFLKLQNRLIEELLNDKSLTDEYCFKIIKIVKNNCLNNRYKQFFNGIKDFVSSLISNRGSHAQYALSCCQSIMRRMISILSASEMNMYRELISQKMKDGDQGELSKEKVYTMNWMMDVCKVNHHRCVMS